MVSPLLALLAQAAPASAQPVAGESGGGLGEGFAGLLGGAAPVLEGAAEATLLADPAQLAADAAALLGFFPIVITPTATLTEALRPDAALGEFAVPVSVPTEGEELFPPAPAVNAAALLKPQTQTDQKSPSAAQTVTPVRGAAAALPISAIASTPQSVTGTQDETPVAAVPTLTGSKPSAPSAPVAPFQPPVSKPVPLMMASENAAMPAPADAAALPAPVAPGVPGVETLTDQTYQKVLDHLDHALFPKLAQVATQSGRRTQELLAHLQQAQPSPLPQGAPPQGLERLQEVFAQVTEKFTLVRESLRDGLHQGLGIPAEIPAPAVPANPLSPFLPADPADAAALPASGDATEDTQEVAAAPPPALPPVADGGEDDALGLPAAVKDDRPAGEETEEMQAKLSPVVQGEQRLQAGGLAVPSSAAKSSGDNASSGPAGEQPPLLTEGDVASSSAENGTAEGDDGAGASNAGGGAALGAGGVKHAEGRDAYGFARALNHAAAQPVGEQVAFHIRTQAQSGNTKIDIHLDPPELGKVEIRLDVAQDGKTGVTVTVDNKHVLDLLQRDARGLERALADAGLKADSGSLSFNLRGGQHDQPQQQAGGQYPTPLPEEDAAEQQLLAAVASQRYTLTLDEGVDITI